jgi:hypothetical protein
VLHVGHWTGLCVPALEGRCGPRFRSEVCVPCRSAACLKLRSALACKAVLPALRRQVVSAWSLCNTTFVFLLCVDMDATCAGPKHARQYGTALGLHCRRRFTLILRKLTVCMQTPADLAASTYQCVWASSVQEPVLFVIFAGI